MSPLSPPAHRRQRAHAAPRAIAGCACLLLACSAPSVRAAQPAGAAAAVPVTMATVTRANVADVRTGIGTVQPLQSVTVRTRVDGQLLRLGFTEGQDVRQGQLLAQIDPRAYQAQLEQVLAQKARDEASLSAAQKDLDRYATLVNQGSIQRQALDAQQATVGQLRAALLADQAQIDNARVQLSYTSIVAPISGRTGLRQVDAGNLVRATDANGLVVINQIDPIAVVFTLPDDSFPAVNDALRRSGARPLTAVAVSRSDGSALATGRLLLVNNRIDSTNGTFQLKAEFPNPQHRLWPGQYVSVQLAIGEDRDALTVPATAIQRGPNGLYVYVVRADGTAEQRPVRTASRSGPVAVVLSGLQDGERVVSEGQLRISPGARVVAAGAAAAGGASSSSSAAR